ncbi:MAG: VOC family protein [Candidatus Sericytochromatia bacterium]
MKIKIKQLNHIQLCIPIGKENEARNFYSDILGFKEIPKPESLIKNGGLWYELANIQLHLGVEDFENKSKAHPAFEIENLEQVKNYLKEKKIQINEEIPIPMQNRFSFRDPFGNRIEFLEKF